MKNLQRDELGRPLLGGISLVCRIGRGGMGAVYYGIHPRLMLEVAIKILPFHLAEEDPRIVERFVSEARMAAALADNHLVRVLDVNKEEDTHYLVMEYVSGESAGTLLKRRKAEGRPGLEELEALEIITAATRGLVVAHGKGVIHRDIKPDNILIPREGLRKAKLTDLGLAKPEWAERSIGTSPHVAMGTPGYMAPEQAEDARSAGPEADIFATGATLYALLSGSAPFTGTSLAIVLRNTVEKDPEPLPECVSRPTREVVERCLRKDPTERFTNASELVSAFVQILASMGRAPEGSQVFVGPERRGRPSPLQNQIGTGDTTRKIVTVPDPLSSRTPPPSGEPKPEAGVPHGPPAAGPVWTSVVKRFYGKTIVRALTVGRVSAYLVCRLVRQNRWAFAGISTVLILFVLSLVFLSVGSSKPAEEKFVEAKQFSQVVERKHIADQRVGRKEPPAVVEVKFDPRKIHPWGYAMPRSWVRHRISVEVDGQKTSESYRDRGVKELAEREVTLVIVISEGEPSEITETFGGDAVRILPDETIPVNRTPTPCLVVEIDRGGTVTKLWIARTGRGEGWLVVKRESVQDGAPLREVATKVGDEQFPFDGRNDNLLVVAVEYDVEDASGSASRKVWYHYDTPGRIVSSEERHGSRVVREKMVDWGAAWEQRPPFPVPEAAAKHPEEPKPVRRPDPWAGRAEGSWIRLRTTVRKAGREEENFTDVGLHKREPDALVYQRQLWRKGTAMEPTTQSIPTMAALKIRVVKEETLKIEARSYPCQAEEYESERGAERVWIPKEGGATPLRAEIRTMKDGNAITLVTIVTRISSETIPVSGTEFSCSVYDRIVEGDPSGTIRERVWISPDCPGGVVKQMQTAVVGGEETVTTIEVVAMGDDWSKRSPVERAKESDTATPKPPTAREVPKPEEDRRKAEEDSQAARAALREADRLVVEAKPLFLEVKKVIKEKRWPEGVDGVGELLQKARKARKCLAEAWEKYDRGRPVDPVRIDKILPSIGQLLDTLDGYIKEIEERQK